MRNSIKTFTKICLLAFLLLLCIQPATNADTANQQVRAFESEVNDLKRRVEEAKLACKIAINNCDEPGVHNALGTLRQAKADYIRLLAAAVELKQRLVDRLRKILEELIKMNKSADDVAPDVDARGALNRASGSGMAGLRRGGRAGGRLNTLAETIADSARIGRGYPKDKQAKAKELSKTFGRVVAAINRLASLAHNTRVEADLLEGVIKELEQEWEIQKPKCKSRTPVTSVSPPPISSGQSFTQGTAEQQVKAFESAVNDLKRRVEEAKLACKTAITNCDEPGVHNALGTLRQAQYEFIRLLAAAEELKQRLVDRLRKILEELIRMNASDFDVSPDIDARGALNRASGSGMAGLRRGGRAGGRLNTLAETIADSARIGRGYPKDKQAKAKELSRTFGRVVAAINRLASLAHNARVEADLLEGVIKELEQEWEIQKPKCKSAAKVNMVKPVNGPTDEIVPQGQMLTVEVSRDMPAKKPPAIDDEIVPQGQMLTIEVSRDMPAKKPPVIDDEIVPQGQMLTVEVSRDKVVDEEWWAWLQQVFPIKGNNLMDPNNPIGDGDTTGKTVEAIRLNLGFVIGFVPLSCIENGMRANPEGFCPEKECPKVTGKPYNHLHDTIKIKGTGLTILDLDEFGCGHGCIELVPVGELLLPFRGLCER